MSITSIIFIILIPVVLFYFAYLLTLSFATNKTAKDELVLLTFNFLPLAILTFSVFSNYYADKSYLRWLLGLVLIYGVVRTSFDLFKIIKRIRKA